jgi:hypothetical protein
MVSTKKEVVFAYQIIDRKSPVQKVTSTEVASYQMTLDPTTIVAARAYCLHRHGRFPYQLWETDGQR